MKMQNNMKILKYLMSAVAVLSLAACNHDPDEIVISTVDPAFNKHSDVVVNDVTVNEDFTLVWSAAKFGVEADVEYAVDATYGGSTVTVATTDNCYATLTNSELFDLLGIRLTGAYEVTFGLTATNLASGETKSAQKPLVITFDYTKISYMWILGGYQGWTGDNASSRLLQGADGVFRGFINILAEGDGNNEIKICTQNGWDGTNYGMKDGVFSGEGDAGNITLTKGLHYLEVNLDEVTLLDIPVTKVGIIGEGVGGWDKDYSEMRYNADKGVWEGVAKVISGKEYKVRFNDAWNVVVDGKEYDFSLGGATTDLQFKGSNLLIEGDGIVSFEMNIFDYPYTIKEGAGLEENNEVLYIASSVTGWNYGVAPQMQPQYDNSVFNGTFCGMVNMPEAGEILFARLPTEYGTRFGGSLAALETYAGGAAATGIAISKGLHYAYANLNDGAMKAAVIDITSIGLVGNVNGWNAGAPIELTYDAASDSFKVSDVAFETDGEFKIIMNKMWNTSVDGVTHQMSLGGSCTNLVVNGGNLFITKGTHSFELTFNSTLVKLAIDGVVADLSANPDFLEITGSFAHYNWNLGDPSPALMPYKQENEFAGFVDMYKPEGATGDVAEFKVTYPNWSTWLAPTLQEGTTYSYTISADGGNGQIPFGLYFWSVILNARDKAGVATATPITSIGLIGNIDGDGWSKQFPLTSAGKGIYTGEFKIDSEFKVRMNDDWGFNLGLPSDGTFELGKEVALAPDAGNLKVNEAGTYAVTLNMAKTPNTILVEKK